MRERKVAYDLGSTAQPRLRWRAHRRAPAVAVHSLSRAGGEKSFDLGLQKGN
jgi:hypothetical protein